MIVAIREGPDHKVFECQAGAATNENTYRITKHGACAAYIGGHDADYQEGNGAHLEHIAYLEYQGGHKENTGDFIDRGCGQCGGPG